MPAEYLFTPRGLSLADLLSIIQEPKKVRLSEDAVEAIVASNAFLHSKIDSEEHPNYGINTGFGKLCNVRISREHLAELQINLIRSHACGAGEVIPDEIARIIILLKIQNLCMGYSGVRVALVQRLVDLYNADIIPLIYSQGSLGASGDLAPLAHMSLALLGEGMAKYKGQVLSAAKALELAGIEPVILGPKEGLALINGTQFCTAYAAWSVIRAERIIYAAHLAAAASFEGYAAHTDPLHPELHAIRNQHGQIWSAHCLEDMLQAKARSSRQVYDVQDPYSFRCSPQVLGASIDAWKYARDIVSRELNSVTDNPNLLIEHGKIISGGNFHAQPIALALDFLAIALAEIASISERRTYLLVSGGRDLPVVLTDDPGLHSGLMIVQYTAAAIVSQNKQLCTPASVDSIISSLGQEDHVSMGANAATKCYQVMQNTIATLGIEWLCAAQAIEYRDYILAPAVEKAVREFRILVPRLKEDRVLNDDMKIAADFLMRTDPASYISEEL